VSVSRRGVLLAAGQIKKIDQNVEGKFAKLNIFGTLYVLIWFFADPVRAYRLPTTNIVERK